MARQFRRRAWSPTDASSYRLADSPPSSATASSPRWVTPFGSWVRGFTVARLVSALRAGGHTATRAAVHHWVAGRAIPQPRAKALAIVELSRGSVSLEDIYRQRDRASPGAESHDAQPRAAGDAPAD
jgi:hypothetical protein